MKKLLIIVTTVIVMLTCLKESKVVIPKESIRFRVIASSNEKEDQELKYQVTENIGKELFLTNFQSKDLNSAKNAIKEQIPLVEKIVEKTLSDNNAPNKYRINYGLNYFPEKEYKGIIYEEGEYESLVVTLGDGLGENFWCVLFPPLCLLEADKTETEDVKYTSFIKEVIEKYF